jgi:hypothetical protein
MAVDEAFEAVEIKRCTELVGEIQVMATVRNEERSLPLSERGRPACCPAISLGFDEAGPDESCATSAIARSSYRRIEF